MFFDRVPEGPPDPIFGLYEAFQADPRPNKVNLAVGVYKDEQLKSHLLPSVQKAKQEILAQDQLADYLPIDGLADFYEQIGGLVFTEWQKNRGRIYAAQSIGGTGALQIGGQFLLQEVTKKIALPSPTWPNHQSIFLRAGLQVETYSYYSQKLSSVDFSALCAALYKLEEKTAVLLHTVCHNPTGCDLTLEQWRTLSGIIKEKKLLPFFDFAYHGFGDGLEEDRRPIELFMQEGHEMLIAYSCSKNFSLYSQRVGVLFIVDQNTAVKSRISSQARRIIRSIYSNPPAHGARIALHILKSDALRKSWSKDVAQMRNRLSSTRDSLVEKLCAKASNVDFRHLRHHKGMFSFMGLDKSQVDRLIQEFGIYLTDNGRISLAGLTQENIDYVVDSVISVHERFK